MSVRSQLPLLTLAATLALLACDGDGPSGPPDDDDDAGDPALQIVGGAPQQDTVFAGPLDSLLVRVRTPDGRGVAGVRVIFRTLTERSQNAPIHLLRSGRELEVVEDTTDGDGRAGALPGFGGPRAGFGWIGIEVPELGTVDSAFYVVLPGTPTEPAHGVFPSSPTVAVGNETTVHAVRRDAHGNDVSVAPTACSSASPHIVLLDACTVLGVSFGNAELTVEHEQLVQRVTVGVMPPGLVAVPAQGIVLLMELDGTVHSRLSWGRELDWAPSGDRLVMVRSADFSAPPHLWVQLLTGEIRELIPSFATSPGEESPQYSADGRWIYFSALQTEGRAEIWRVPAEGGTPERFGPVAQARERHRYPSPAPDGSAVAYAHDFDLTSEIRIIDAGTRQARSLGVSGTFPRWSPDGAWIAFMGSQGLAIIRPDGTGLRILDTPGQMEWSPDGRYILSNGVVDVATGEIVRYGSFPHRFGGFSGLPAWKP